MDGDNLFAPYKLVKGTEKCLGEPIMIHKYNYKHTIDVEKAKHSQIYLVDQGIYTKTKSEELWVANSSRDIADHLNRMNSTPINHIQPLDLAVTDLYMSMCQVLKHSGNSGYEYETATKFKEGIELFCDDSQPRSLIKVPDKQAWLELRSELVE